MGDLPYLPDGVDDPIHYRPETDPYLQEARATLEQSLDDNHPAAAVIVVEDEIVGRGANGSRYHQDEGCERQRLRDAGRDIASGEGYDLCEGCGYEHHAEPTAIRDALDTPETDGADHGDSPLDGAELYMWGHWWCCEPCWDSMLDVGIETVHLPEDAEILFSRDFADHDRNLLP